MQLHDPLVLLHAESALQLCVPMKHLSISVYVDYSLYRGRMSLTLNWEYEILQHYMAV